MDSHCGFGSFRTERTSTEMVKYIIWNFRHQDLNQNVCHIYTKQRLAMIVLVYFLLVHLNILFVDQRELQGILAETFHGHADEVKDIIEASPPGRPIPLLWQDVLGPGKVSRT